MWLRRAFHASPSALPGSVRLAETSATSGPRRPKFSSGSSHLSPCSKTCPACSQLDLLTGGTTSEPCSVTWPRSGSMRSGVVAERMMLAPRTSASGSGFWPTPQGRDHKSGRAVQDYGNARPLSEAVHKAPYPTPSATAYGSSGNGGGWDPGPAELGEDVHSDADRGRREERWLEMRSGERGASGGELDGLRARGWGKGPDVDNANGAGPAHGGEDEARSGELGPRAREGETAGAAGGGSRADGLQQGGRRDESAGDRLWWERDPAEVGPESQSFVGRVAHGVAHRVDRLRALGNGQVPAVVVRAWRELAGRAGVLT